MKQFIILVCTLLLTGCATIFDKGAVVNDNAVMACEAVICLGGSIGAIQRRYGSNKRRAAAWRVICLPTNEGGIVQ